MGSHERAAPITAFLALILMGCSTPAEARNEMSRSELDVFEADARNAADGDPRMPVEGGLALAFVLRRTLD